jgi:hypothetical protein
VKTRAQTRGWACASPRTRARALLCAALLLTGGCAEETERGPLRTSLSLNGAWEAAPAGVGGSSRPDALDLRYAPVRVPEDLLARADPAVRALWYRRTITLPDDLQLEGARAFLHFDKVGHAAVVHLNGRRYGEHYGQFAPFDVEITGGLRPGENTFHVLVHEASGEYVRGRPRREGLADASIYRPGGPLRRDPLPRNWAGIVGDVSLEIRPDTFVAGIFPTTSVRARHLGVEVEVAGNEDEALSVEATVYDGERPVLELAAAPVRDGAARLGAAWQSPQLWGVGAYGTPTLYTLRVGLSRGHRLVDRAELRFGFREVWTDGADVLLNGRKLFLIGTYPPPRGPDWLYENRMLTAYRYRALHRAGFDTVSFHWDRPTRNAYEVADELGMLVVGQLYCHGPLRLRGKDPGWVPFLEAAVRDWVRAYRQHPSIVLWSPLHYTPLASLSRGTDRALAAAIPSLDPTRLVAGVDFEDFSAGNDPDRIPLRVQRRRVLDPERPLLNVESWGPLDATTAAAWLRAAQRLGWFGWIHQHQLPEPQRGSSHDATWPAEPVSGVVPTPAVGDAANPDVDAGALSLPGPGPVGAARARLGVGAPAPLASRYVPDHWIDFGPGSGVEPGGLVRWSRREGGARIARGGFVDRRGRFLLSAREPGAYVVRAGGEVREMLVSARDFEADGQRYRIERTDWIRLKSVPADADRPPFAADRAPARPAPLPREPGEPPAAGAPG